MDIFAIIDKTVEGKHSYAVSSNTLKELEKIAKNQGRTGAAARLGLKIYELHKKEIEVVISKQAVDSWIVKYAAEENAIVCTNDKQLKNKLKQKGIKVIATKGKNWLGFV